MWGALTSIVFNVATQVNTMSELGYIGYIYWYWRWTGGGAGGCIGGDVLSGISYFAQIGVIDVRSTGSRYTNR